jgi:thiol-disulfide isomerase/thioredoxin
VVNLWATWCTPCIKEMPSLLDLHQSGEAVVVAVSTDRMTERVGTFLTQHGLNDLPVRIDPGARALRAADLTPPALPITFIVRRQPDGTFVIKGAELGEREWAHPTMRRKIRQVFDR